MRAVATAVWAAVRGRRLQSLVVGAVLLLSTATAVLAIGLLVVSKAPFDQAFAGQSGAHATATFDASRVTGAELAKTADAAGVSAVAGPFEGVDTRLVIGSMPLAMSATVVGRSEQNGPVDQIAVDKGGWLDGPGEIVISRDLAGPRRTAMGDTVTLDLPGSPRLRVVGVAISVTGTADAWVWPTQSDVLHAEGAMTFRQVLYRFGAAGDETAVRDSLNTATAGLPAGAMIGSSSYLDARFSANRSSAPVVPFVVAFAVLGLAMAVFIVANVVSGAVVAGRRTIGVLKSLGFTPRQVIVTYCGQALLPGVVGGLLGLVVGNALAQPVLGQTGQVYGVAARVRLPWWVNAVAILVAAAVVVVAAQAAAWRAGRLSAVQAISTGRAPRSGRGYRIRRALAATRLPRPVSFGLGTPFARPARSISTLLAVLLGAVTVVFAVGLSGSLTRVLTSFTRTAAVPVDVRLPMGGPQARPGNEAGSDPAAVRTIIESQPGTARVIGIHQGTATAVELNEAVAVVGYEGDASWVGYALVEGRWYEGPDEVIADSYLLRSTGTAIGDTLTLRTERGQRRVRVVGEVLDQTNHGLALIGQNGVFAELASTTAPNQFEIGLTGGVDATRYVETLSTALGTQATARERAMQGLQREMSMMFGLLTILTLLLSGVAALGVFNTVVLNIRERAQEIGVLKSIGMTPRQIRTMVLVSVAGIGLLAGAIATPLGLALHSAVVPLMAEAADIGAPPSFLDVYQPLQLVAVAAAGVLLAMLGALVPAGWAARTRAAVALRAE